jgi:glutathione synthase/RimK-type ligase-like ATP-grasp enzyme
MSQSPAHTPANQSTPGPEPSSFGVVFKGLPDNQMGRVTLDKEGAPTVLMPNRIVLPKEMERALLEKGRTVWLPTRCPISVSNVSWIVNTMADADEYQTALRYLDRATASLGLPILNPAAGILQTRRDRAKEVLSDIPGLEVPNCVRFEPKVPSDFREIFEKEGFEYPVLVRPTRSQTAAGLVQIETESDWNRIFETPWIGTSVYMTQWIDHRRPDGWYAKARIVVAGDQVSVRHVLRSDHWLIHAMERTEESAAWELSYLRQVKEWETVQRIGEAARDRFGLDFFGMDVGMLEDDRFVLFEANAAMSILSDYKMPNIRRNEFWENLQSIEREVIDAFAQKGVPITASAASF